MGRPEKRGQKRRSQAEPRGCGRGAALVFAHLVSDLARRQGVRLSLPGVLGAVRIPALAVACHHRKPGEGGRSTILSREPMLRPFLQSTLKRQHEIRRCRRRWNAFRLGPFLSVHQLPRQGPTMCWPDTAATGVMTTGDVRIFRAELASHQKGLPAGLLTTTWPTN
jgi:hypothetical protein